MALKPIRRLVTGNDEQGRSRVVWDGPAPSQHEAAPGAGRGWTDLWIWEGMPAPLSEGEDAADRGYHFPGPPEGGHLRVVQSLAKPPGYDPAKDPDAVPSHEPRVRPDSLGRTFDRGGASAWASAMHKTETIDYGILLEGERVLVLDDTELLMRPGDVVVQVGAWHQWQSPRQGSRMAFDMYAARFVDGPAGTVQASPPTVQPAVTELPDGVRAPRRIVTIDREPGKGSLVADGPAPDVRFDEARPGYADFCLWVNGSHPAGIVTETLHLPHCLEPASGGSICRVLTVPPDDSWRGKVGASHVRAFFQMMGSPGASTYTNRSPHPYMQKTRALEFGLVLEGDITLVLDTQEVHLNQGDIAVLRGVNHAWSNRSYRPAMVAVCSHDGGY